MEMEEYGTNTAEGLLCEISLSHVGQILDYVYYGQMLFRISNDGKNWLKQFRSTTWEERVLGYKDWQRLSFFQ
jgi:hypothetical protein